VRQRLRLLAASILALALAGAGCGDEPPAKPKFFASDSVWNRPLGDSARLHPASPGLVGELARQLRVHGAWINSTEFSVPIYTVPKDQPGVSVHIDTPSDMFTGIPDATKLAQTLEGMPIPPDARPAAGTDRHLVVWQPSTDTMWELWIAHRLGDGFPSRDDTPGWHASWGAKIAAVSRSPGVIQPPFGATASGLPLVGGLITLDELESGHIDHALALAAPDVKQGEAVPPATRTDGAYAGPNAIPEGTRFRLPASLDLDSLDLPPVTRMIADAAQRYGMIVRDRAGSVAFYAEDPIPSGNPVLRRKLGDQSPAEALARFPWDRLQALTPP
jgi:hypothetical protein